MEFPPPLPGLGHFGWRFRWLTPPANFHRASGSKTPPVFTIHRASARKSGRCGRIRAVAEGSGRRRRGREARRRFRGGLRLPRHRRRDALQGCARHARGKPSRSAGACGLLRGWRILLPDEALELGFRDLVGQRRPPPNESRPNTGAVEYASRSGEDNGPRRKIIQLLFRKI